MSSRKDSQVADEGENREVHIQTPGGIDFLAAKSTFDFNSSLMIPDLNTSMLDGKKQAELSTILAHQEKLLLEKNYEHKEILDEYKQLKEQFIMKDTETARLKKMLQEQKDEVEAYKSKVKTQHEEIVARVRLAEETVKELAGFSTALGKIAVGVYGLGVRHFNEILNGVNNFTVFKEHLKSSCKELDSAFQPLLAKHQSNPKRLLTYLEEVKTTMGFVKDKFEGKSWMENLLELSKSREEEKRERGSLRRQSFKTQPSLPTNTSSGNIKMIAEPELQKMMSESRSIVEIMLQKFSEMSGYLGSISPAGISKPKKDGMLPEPDSRICIIMGQFADPLEKYLRANLSKVEKQNSIGFDPNGLAALHQEHKTILETEVSDFQTELQNVIGEADALQEELAPKLRNLCSIKEQIRTGRAELEAVQQSLRAVEEEIQGLQSKLDETKTTSDKCTKLLNADREEKNKLSIQIRTEQDLIDRTTEEARLIQNQILLMRQTLSQLKSELEKLNAQKAAFYQQKQNLQDELGEVQMELEFKPPQQELSPISTKHDNSHPQKEPENIKSPFTTAKKSKPKKDQASDPESDSTTKHKNPDLPSLTPHIQQAKQDIAALESALHTAPTDATAPTDHTSAAALLSSLYQKKADLQAEQAKHTLLLTELTRQTDTLATLTTSLESLQTQTQQTADDLKNKTRQVHVLQTEEAAAREAYTREYLRLESVQQRLLGLQARVERFRLDAGAVRKTAGGKMKEVLKLKAALGSGSAGREMVTLSDEKRGNHEPLLADEERGLHDDEGRRDKHQNNAVAAQQQNGDFLKMAAASLASLTLGYILYRLGLV